MEIRSIRRVEEAVKQLRAAAHLAVPVDLEVGVAALPGEPIPAGQAAALEYAPSFVGVEWGKPWSTWWFRFSGQLPADVPAKHCHLELDLGFKGDGPGFTTEGFAFNLQGEPIKGVHSWNRLVPLAELTTDGAFTLLLEAAANPSFTDIKPSPRSDVITADDALLYRLESARVVLENLEAAALATDLEVVLDWIQNGQNPIGARLLSTHLDNAMVAIQWGIEEESISAARQALKPVFEGTPADFTVSAIGHAHIDTAWLWPIREARRKCLRTFTNLLRLARAREDFRHVIPAAQHWAWVKEEIPALWDELKAACARGAVRPIGGMWVETDAVLPGSEAFVRQIVEGQRFFREELDEESTIAWLPDSFGYGGAIPQVLRLAGFEFFFTQKMNMNDTNAFPYSTFHWEGIDGSRIISHYPPASTYGARVSAKEISDSQHRHTELERSTGGILPFGHGDGGGGPTMEMIDRVERFASFEGAPRVVMEHPEEFFARVRNDDLPIWTGEIYLEFHRGTSTTQAKTKLGNRRCEALLFEAELWHSQAALAVGHPYPHDEFSELWREVALLQFHDILPGSSIGWVHREAEERHGRVIGRLEELVSEALTALTGGQGKALAVTASPLAAGGRAMAISVAEAPPVAEASETESGWRLSGPDMHVEIGLDGTLASLVSRGVELLTEPANRLVVHPDRPGEWPAWDLDRDYMRGSQPVGGGRAELVEIDGVPTVRVEHEFGRSRATQTTSLDLQHRRVDLETEVDWHEDDRLLKAHFPLAVHTSTYLAETMFGHVQRSCTTTTSYDRAGFETPAHRWLLLPHGDRGLAIINEASGGHSVVRQHNASGFGPSTTDVGLSLLRSPEWPDPTADRGKHTFRYALLPDADPLSATQSAQEIAHPVRQVSGTGDLAPLVTVGGQVNVTTVKLAEDRSGDLIVRIHEVSGAAGPAELGTGFQFDEVSVVDLLERYRPEVADLATVESRAAAITLQLQPFQIVTLRFAGVRVSD